MILLKTILMIMLTIVVFFVSTKLQARFRNPLLNPALITALFIIIVLLLFGQDYNDYMLGGKWINYLLSCSVVSLAMPLYQHRHKIMKHAPVIFTSVLTAVFINFLIVYGALKILGFSKLTIITMLPRSITAAVGIQVSQQLGGNETLTVLFIMATGLLGSMAGEYLISIAKFKSSIARGLSYGNAAHGFGTAKALEYDFESGAYSSIGMILTAILSSILIPLFILIFY